ncbi:MAG TPA: FkbM family methyltransferase [Telluria sp.]|nr:FkbM family methyltransferase [Telluria sp.]
MTFISYAQNFEDVLLWRALGHVRNGFYIDVGANDPEEHSVTRAFYDAGWHGINVEPLPQFKQAFIDQRPRDINLAMAAGAADGALTLYDVEGVSGWASPDPAVAQLHRADGRLVRELEVPVRTLASICAEHVRGEIHFLKIDVEGWEADVLRGMDFARWRPWVVVIEATTPASRESRHESWEAMLTGAGYGFAWFDGLNRYYVAEEHVELAAALKVQPNVFDAFITHHLDKAWRDAENAHRSEAALQERLARESELRWQSDQRLDQERALVHDALAHARELSDSLSQAREREAQLREQAAALHQKLDQALREGHAAAQWAHDLDARLNATLQSTSWRVTAPLRFAGRIVKRLRAGSATAAARRHLRAFVTRLTANERLRRLVIPVLVRFPSLGRRVSSTLQAIKQAAPHESAGGLQVDAPALPPEIKALPASARRVAADVQRALGLDLGN